MDEIRFVHPRHELTAVTGPATQPATGETHQRIEDAASIRTERHRRAKQNLPRGWRGGFLEGLLPGAGHVDAELPGIGHILFVTAEDARLQ